MRRNQIGRRVLDRLSQPSSAAGLAALLALTIPELIACEKTGRHARLVELDPKYCDVICRRFEEFSGEVAVLDADGRSFDEIVGVREAA